MVWEQCLSPAGYFQRLMKIVSCECTLWYHSCTTDNSVWPYRFVKHIEMQKAFPCWFRYILFPTRTVTGQNIFLTVISNTLKTWMKSKIYDEIFRVCCYTFGVCSQAEWHTSVHKYSFFFFFSPEVLAQTWWLFTPVLPDGVLWVLKCWLLAPQHHFLLSTLDLSLF